MGGSPKALASVVNRAHFALAAMSQVLANGEVCASWIAKTGTKTVPIKLY